MKCGLAAMTAWALDAIAPRRCAACDRDTAEAFCADCSDRLTTQTPSVDTLRVIALGAYEHPLSTAIRRLKYEDRTDLADPLGRALGRVVREHLREPVDLVVPVPLHPKRLAARGFNQASLLARSLSREIGAPLDPRAIVRGRETTAQAGLDRGARRANVAGAFAARRQGAVRARSILLVDDVVTTGSSARECQRALERDGARVAAISALAVAGGC